MALNCTMLDPATNAPIPLPHEKIFLSVTGVTVTLTPTPPGSDTTTEPTLLDQPTSPSPVQSSKVKPPLQSILSGLSLRNPDRTVGGTIYITNQRIIFVASAAAVAAATSSSVDPEIRTLTVPLRHSLDGRYVQPWLSANYHLSTVLPVPGGNLESLGGLNPAPDLSFTLKVAFNEGHGFEFYETLEEVKRVMFESESQRPAEIEDLPTYSPSTNPTTLVSTNDQASSNPSTSISAPGSPHRRQDSTMPDEDLLQAAQTALEEEHHEHQQLLVQTAAPRSHTDEPPLYEP
ncbi:hypothetical protein CROQUDRAFT_663692 [Cronartium quercuum f. sp. fusiforme G11]|uniref:GRAM domain-containing protein n=1 Tax=Cronartium quercuum f. sp. fusiforme G11 TaxID=708437 RepID=A0A9P6NC45_9BASI|nr:hypothetical protein CROQUDRAFT_663692 [Cronartium quercuum f. sp. fusiforme G11]